MAGRIPQPFIDEVVARADIVEIIGARVPLKKSGREFKACCPFHNEKSPSFWVSPEKQFYHCFGCGAHGTVIGFLMEYEKLEFVDAVADLAQRAGLEVPRDAQGSHEPGSGDLHDLMSRVARFFEQNLADDERAREYAKQRGIDAPTAAAFALGFAPDSWNAVLNRFGPAEEERRRLLQVGLIIERDTRGGERTAGFYDRFRDRLMFPIRDARGRVIAFGGRIIDQGEPKYLNSPETPLFHKGSELYGLYEARKSHGDFARVVIVEGYMDVVRLHQAGVTYAVATLGTATTQDHLNKLFRLTSELVFCFDGDNAGRKAAWRALENALPLARDGRELKFMFLPDGHDPDTLVAAEGKAGFETRLQGASSLSEYLTRELVQQVDMASEGGRARLKALAQPLFTRMPDGVYRELLAERLAAEIRMPAAKLKELLLGTAGAAADGRGTAGRDGPDRGNAAARRPEPSRDSRGRMSAGRGNMLTQAIALLLHYPAAATGVQAPERLDSVDKAGVAVLRELISQGLEITREAPSGSSPSTAALLERWRGRAEYGRLAELAIAAPLVADAASAAQELGMAVEKLVQEFGPGRRMDELLRKAEESGLNYEEKTELSRLLQARSRPPGAA
jgi:DNA primase